MGQDAGHDEAIDALERSLWAVLTRLSHRSFGDAVADAAGYDLPPTSWTLLEFLSRSGPLRVSEIAAYNGVDVSSVTPRLKALEADRFIERGPDPADGRVSMISLGAAGREAVEKMRAARRDLYSKALADSDEAEIRSASALVSQLAERLGRQL